MLTEPKVSLLIPVHGDAIFLKKTLNNIRDCNYSNLEIIIILDRATENVQTQILDYCNNESRSILIKSELPGISNALNAGIAVSSGEYIARLDCDDLMSPERIQAQVQFLEANRDYAVYGTQMLLITELGEPITYSCYPSRNFTIRIFLKIRNCIGHPTVLVRKSALTKVNGYRSFFNGAEDFDLWIRISRFSKIANLNQPLTKYRVSNFQTSLILKDNPGLVEDAVILANVFEPKSDYDFSNLATNDELMKFSSELKTAHAFHPIVRRVKSLGLLREIVKPQITLVPIMLVKLGKSFIISPSTTIYFIIYGAMNLKKREF